jgi:iron complex outermembrane receptor protein
MWTLNDFAFRNDAVYGNNKIPGAPRNVLRSSIAYTQPSGFYFTPTLDWIPQGAWADDKNMTRIKGYALLGLQTGMEWHNGISLFVDARNLADRRYVSDISTVVLASSASSIYYPGDGRNVYAGMRYAF